MNDKGFTLIEMLAVVIILAILTMIMVPTVNTIITKSQEENYKNLKNSILSAAKVYLSDNRYEVVVAGTCDSSSADKNIGLSIGESEIIDDENSKLFIKVLVDAGDIKTNAQGQIINPKNKNQILDLNGSYVRVKYSCQKKDFNYILEDEYLKWIS